MGQFVRVDVYELQKDIDRLQESKEALKRAFGETGIGVENLRRQWKGEAADQFMNGFLQQSQKYEEILRELELLIERLLQSQRDYQAAKDELGQLVDDFRV